MDILGGAANFLVSNLVGIGVGVAGAVIVKPVVGWAWEHVKPLQPFTDYAVKRFNNFGRKTRDLAIKRIGEGPELEKIIDDLVASSEKVQDAFVAGLRGQSL